MKGLREIQNEFLKAIQSDQKPSGLQDGSRFGVYSRAYRIRLIESLEEDFPETLKDICNTVEYLEAYIKKYPSSFWTLGEFGVNFPAYVESTYPRLARSAKREWAQWVARSIGEPQIPPASTTEGEIVLVINNSLQIVSDEMVEVIYYFRQDLREEVISSQEELILRKCLNGKSVSELGLSEDRLVPLVTRWTEVGIVIGFKEVS